jgi:hypothetical protein
MIETIETSSPKVVGFKLSGRLHDEDYKQFVPKIETIMTAHGKVRLFVQFEDFHGWDLHAAWDRRINYCRRFQSIVVVYVLWKFCEMEDCCNGKEAKDGVCISGAVRTARRGTDAGVLADVVRAGSTAVRCP